MNDKRNSPLIVPQTVSALTADSLRERILRGDFEEGQALIQDDLASQYGVSRIPLREALRQLESEGLVTSIPHRGCMVAVLSEDEVVELSEIRALLECDVLSYAIPNMTKEHFDRAQEVLDASKELMTKSADEHDCEAQDWEFYSVLFEASNRIRTLKLISNLHNSLDRMARIKVAAATGMKKTHRRHSDFLKLCKQEKVEEAIENHRNYCVEVGIALRKHM